jgi:Acyl dehydratase
MASAELPPELEKLKGAILEPDFLEIERGAIRRYADALGDYNPLFWDVDYAKDTRYGDLICPPGFFGRSIKQVWMIPPSVMAFMSKIGQVGGLAHLLDGGVEYEFMAPAHAGDTLAALYKVVDITLRETKGGKMIFSTLETRYINQNGTLVGKSLMTFIFR